MLEFLQMLFNLLVGWIPRFKIVEPDEQGIHLRLGHIKRVVDEGLWWWWPIIDSFQVLQVTRQIIDLPVQFVDTRDGKTLAVDMSLEYEIDNPIRHLYTAADADVNLRDVCTSLIADLVQSLDSNLCRVPHIVERLWFRLDAEGAADDYGVRITNITIRSFCKARRIYTGE